MPATLETACPRPDEIYLWASGHDRDTPRGLAISRHLLSCVRCGAYLNTSLAIIDDVSAALSMEEDEVTTPVDDEKWRAFTRGAHERVRRAEHDASALFEGAPESWPERLMSHSRRSKLDFLYHVAQTAVLYADEKPAAVIALVPSLVDLVAQATQPVYRASGARALIALAEGAAEAAQGDYVRALQCYARGEQDLIEPALQIEHPYLVLARAAALRHLKRFDEARTACELARQSFARCGIRGEGKALWQLANIAWETGQARQSFRLGCQAHRRLLAERNADEATVMLQIVAMALLELRRPRPARRILEYLESNGTILGRAHQYARVLWTKANLAALEGDEAAAMKLLEDASARFATHGALLDAARSQLDLAHVAGQAGDLSRQVHAATKAAEILGALPGQQPEWANAIALLREALEHGAAMAQAVSAARSRLGR